MDRMLAKPTQLDCTIHHHHHCLDKRGKLSGGQVRTRVTQQGVRPNHEYHHNGEVYK